MDKLLVVEGIPFNRFKEKINITKEFDGKARVEIIEDLIYIEREIEDEED